jgi:hypothetical protein
MSWKFSYGAGAMPNRDGSSRVSKPRFSSWSGESVLEAVRRLNCKFLALLAEIAGTAAAQERFPAVFKRQECWRLIDQAACRRGGMCPVLLADFHFTDLNWWIRLSHLNTGAAVNDGLKSPIPIESASNLLREILFEAKTWVRAAPSAVSLAFGILPSVRAHFAEMSIAQIDHNSVFLCAELMPRWPRCASFWTGLLTSAIGSDDEKLQMACVHAIQLLGADFARSADDGTQAVSMNRANPRLQ